MALFSVISQEMSNDQIVVRNFVDDLNTKSQLIVYESQEAIFFKEGQALDLFGPGRHTLSTGNIPIIKKIFGAVYGGNTPFPCDIYFINKVSSFSFAWGTDSPIDLMDPKYGLLVKVRANGQTSIHVSDSRKFVVRVVGMLNEFTVDSMRKTIKSLMMSSIKESIASAIIENQVSILEITSKLSMLSDEIQNKLNQRIADLGIQINHFAINAIMPGDGDLDALRKAKNDMMTGMNSADIEAYKIKAMGDAKAYARKQQGFTYQDERRFDVLEKAASNEGSMGGMMNVGVGLGMGSSMGKQIGNMASDAGFGANNSAAPTSASYICKNCNNPMEPNAKFCPQCGTPKPTKRFCSECGTEVDPSAKFCANCGTKLQ